MVVIFGKSNLQNIYLHHTCLQIHSGSCAHIVDYSCICGKSMNVDSAELLRLLPLVATRCISITDSLDYLDPMKTDLIF